MGGRAILYEKTKESLTERPLTKDLRRSGNRTSHVNEYLGSVPGTGNSECKRYEAEMFGVFKKHR